MKTSTGKEPRPASEAAADKSSTDLLTLMQSACDGNPFLTPKGAAILLDHIIDALKKLSMTNEHESYAPEWGTMGQVAKIYGMSPEAMDNYLLPWAAAGKVDVITPTDPVTGKRGRRRYNLAQVAKLMTV